MRRQARASRARANKTLSTVTPVERKRKAQFKLQRKRWQTVLGQEEPLGLCLTMIVKNEAHIIVDTLQHLKEVVRFDTYCIVDTGSTDKTMDLIRTFFTTTCPTPGQLFERVWQGFGHNRTEALQLSYGASEYVLMFDADDRVQGTWPLPDWKALARRGVDGFLCLFGTQDSLQYWRQTIFRNDGNWTYQGALHEYAASLRPNPKTEKLLPSQAVTSSSGEDAYYIESRRLGARSQNPNKYRDDALTFRKLLKRDPTNHRYLFYEAQSWFDFKDYAQAMEGYRRRVKVGGWKEEQWYSQSRIGECLVYLKRPDEAYQAFQAACEILPYRYEAVSKMLTLCAQALPPRWQDGYDLVKDLPVPLPFPHEDLLFIDRQIYDHRLLVDALPFLCHFKSYTQCIRIASSVLKNATTVSPTLRTQLVASLNTYVQMAKASLHGNAPSSSTGSSSTAPSATSSVLPSSGSSSSAPSPSAPSSSAPSSSTSSSSSSPTSASASFSVSSSSSSSSSSSFASSRAVSPPAAAIPDSNPFLPDSLLPSCLPPLSFSCSSPPPLASCSLSLGASLDSIVPSSYASCRDTQVPQALEPSLLTMTEEVLHSVPPFPGITCTRPVALSSTCSIPSLFSSAQAESKTEEDVSSAWLSRIHGHIPKLVLFLSAVWILLVAVLWL